MLDRERDRAGPGPDVHDDGILRPAERVQRELHEHLGLRPGHEHARPHLEADVPERLVAGQVLERRPGAPLAERATEHARLPRVEALGARVQAGAIGLEHLHEQALGAHPGALDAVALQVVGGAAHDLRRTRADQPLPSSPESCAARSAASSASTNSSMSPASTLCSWWDVSFTR